MRYCESPFFYKRRKTREIIIGDLAHGGVESAALDEGDGAFQMPGDFFAAAPIEPIFA